MSYPIFVNVMNQHNILDTSEAEYNASWELYLQDIEDGDTVLNFEEWLCSHIARDEVLYEY